MRRRLLRAVFLLMIVIAATIATVELTGRKVQADVAPPPPCCCEFRDASGALLEHRMTDVWSCNANDPEKVGTCVDVKLCTEQSGS